MRSLICRFVTLALFGAIVVSARDVAGAQPRDAGSVLVAVGQHGRVHRPMSVRAFPMSKTTRPAVRPASLHRPGLQRVRHLSSPATSLPGESMLG